MKTQLQIAIKIFILFTILLGMVYPLFVTGIAQLIFPQKANGSLIIQGNQMRGSELIGQSFDTIYYFSSRPSATNYNPLPSGGSNLGPASARLRELVSERKAHFVRLNEMDAKQEVPSEMLYASASGLDPHISPQAALLQVERIVKARQLSGSQQQELMRTIDVLSEGPQWSLLGQPRINVLRLNLALDQISHP